MPARRECGTVRPISRPEKRPQEKRPPAAQKPLAAERLQAVVLQEPFSCELDRYTINEAVISKTNCSLTNEDLFDTVVEKLNLNLVISIFQLRPVTVTVPGIPAALADEVE